MVTMVRGMRGTGSWSSAERPENYRQQILYMYPNGQTPLTAILSKMGSERTDDPAFHWFLKDLSQQRLTITGVYTDSTLATAYVSGAVAGTVLYVKGAVAEAGLFRKGHQAVFRKAALITLDTVGKIVDVSENGADSFIAVKLLEADDNGGAVTLAAADTLIIAGSINAEGAERPQGVQRGVEDAYNYTGIHRTPLSITRTARKTRLRTKDAYLEAKREALELHSIELEMAFLFGLRTLGTGANGLPERTSMGILPFLRTYAPANVVDFRTLYAGQTWTSGAGQEFMDTYTELLFRYGAQDKLVLCGSGAVMGIAALAKAHGQVNLEVMDLSYGMKARNWVTPVGELKLLTHPLFSQDATLRNSMLVLEPHRLKYRYIDDTNFINDPNKDAHGANGIDGTQEEYLTECGLEMHFPQTMGFLAGVGQDG